MYAALGVVNTILLVPAGLLSTIDPAIVLELLVLSWTAAVLLALTGLLAFLGVLSDPLAQKGLGLFALSWLGLVYLHCQSMDTPVHLRAALRRGSSQSPAWPG